MVSLSSSFSRCSSSSGVRFSFVPVEGFARVACPALRRSPLPPAPARERALEPHTLTSQSAPSSHLVQEQQAPRPERGRAAACKDPRCRHRCAPGPPEQLLQCSKALLPGGIALTLCSAWLPCAYAGAGLQQCLGPLRCVYCLVRSRCKWPKAARSTPSLHTCSCARSCYSPADPLSAQGSCLLPAVTILTASLLLDPAQRICRAGWYAGRVSRPASD